LLNEVLVGVGSHLSALISVEEDEINIDGGSNKGLLVSLGDRDRSGGGSNVIDSPQALTNGSEVDVDLNLVVLESNEGKSKTGVSAEPEEEGTVEGGLRESLAGGANLAGTASSRAGSVDVGKGGVNKVGELGGVSNHLVITSLLLSRKGELVPDVHPVTILSVDSLATNLDLNLRDELLAGEIQPTGINGLGRTLHILVDLRESNLDVGSVSKISVSGDGARNTATEIGLSVECLLDGLHREVGVASVRHLPVSNFRGSSQEHILSAVSY
jgi:hypothetical protein